MNNVPWELVKQAFRVFRAHLFTRPRPEADIYAFADIDTVRIALGKHHFTNGWELSYSYRGEDLNMRRPEYVDDDRRWYQNHVRGWLNGYGVELSCHHELEPTEYPEDHLNAVNYSKEESIELIKSILEEEGIEVLYSAEMNQKIKEEHEELN